MGKMKELQLETQNLAFEWGHMLEKIFSQRNVGRVIGLKPQEAPSSEAEWKLSRIIPDIEFSPPDSSSKVAVEFKMFRWHDDWRRRVIDAISHMKDILATGTFDRGIIVLSLDVSEDTLAQLQRPADADVEIWGIGKLRELVEGDEGLSDDLEELISETIIDERISGPLRLEPEPKQGATLASKLRQTPPGKSGWTLFEKLSDEAVRFLFGRELSNLTAQHRTEDGLNRMDLIGRIKSDGNSFWSMVASDFSTRYVVFDAKNYGEPITQSEIQITEKYLFAKGLRSVAIVIARNGADANALRAAEGQLRENGKVILIITLADLCAMLEGADVGDPPENLLFQRMDEMLMGLGR